MATRSRNRQEAARTRAFDNARMERVNRLKRSGVLEAYYNTPSRFDLSAVPGLVACWDASYPDALPAGAETGMASLGDRVRSNNALASAFAAPNQPVLIPDPPRSTISTTGGNGQRRFDAPADVADNLFSGGGMIYSVQSATSSVGNLIGKWSDTSFFGWLLVGVSGTTMKFESWSDTDTVFNFTIPVASLFLLEIEWNSITPSVAPVVRVNGDAVTVTSVKAVANVAVNDTAATLCVGNKNWGPINTPWNGTIGEVVLFDQIPTTQQRADIRADLMTHWGIV